MTEIQKLVKVLNNMPPLEQSSERRRFRVIARALDKKGRVISTKTNSYTLSHPVQKHFAVMAGRPEAIFVHAEIAALVAAKGKEVHTLLIARVDNNGNPITAAPCEICSIAIKKFGIKEIIHT
jgi:Cytidine and deoxycytidylate deaminase zinc-binding region.